MESASVKIQNIFHRQNDIRCSTDCENRMAVTLYTLVTWFVSGIMIVNTLYKGDKKDDDDDNNNNNNNAKNM
jgi:preprotein translocase subunit SecG